MPANGLRIFEDIVIHVPEDENSAEISEKLDRIIQFLVKLDELFSSPEALSEFTGYAHTLASIYTVLVYILALLVIYGIFKFFSSLFNSM